MECDNCGKDIKDAVITMKSGETWCYKCTNAAKYPKNPKRAKTKDPFVLLARKLRDIHHHEGGSGFSFVIMKSGEKRAYTNGHVLISEMKKTPAKYKLIDMDHLWELPENQRFGYPPIEKLIKAIKGDVVVIPEDFYQYARAFPKSKWVRVQIRRDRITVMDSSDYDQSMVLNYREIEVPSGNEADFKIQYFMALKPREIILDGEKGPAYIRSSYVEGMEKCTSVLLMPMSKDG